MILYLTLFSISFLSATLLPMGSEALLIYDLSLGYSMFWLWFFASLGNTLGSILNYYLGLKGELFLEQKGFIKDGELDRYKGYFSKYGGVLLLLAWTPVIGDPITFVAGVFRYRFIYFVLLVSLSKSMRYLIVILLYSNF